MAVTSPIFDRLTTLPPGAARGPLTLIGLAAVLLAGLLWVQSPGLMNALIAGGCTLALLGLGALAMALRGGSTEKAAHALVSKVIRHDPAPGILTDADGAVVYMNEAGRAMAGDRALVSLADVLKPIFANPSAVLQRLQDRAAAQASASEDVATRRGHYRLSVTRLEHENMLWRVEMISDRHMPENAAGGHSLPMMTTGRSGAILFMNEPMRRLIGSRAKSLDRIFPKLPVKHGAVAEVSTADGPVDCLVAEIEAPGGRHELYLLPGIETHQSEDHWGFFDQLPVPLLKLDAKGEVILCNRGARQLLGREDCRGHNLSEMLEGLGRPIADWLCEAASGRGAGHAEFLLVSGVENERYAQVSLKPVQEGGETVLIAVLNDATELKTLEAQFVQSQKMQAIGQLAGGVAHDFNNLLTAISGHCDLLLLRHDQGDSDYDDLVQINQNTNRAAALVGQLLAFSRKQTLQPEVIDMRDTLSDLTHLLNRLVGEKVTLDLSLDPVLKPIRADKRQLEQVMMNLVVNARDAMPDGGEIRIETEVRMLTEEIRRDRAVVPIGEYVSVKVSDQGVGIPADKVTKVFEPFYTSKGTGEGTGLGLSMAYGIVKQTGGFIFVDSVVGVGTSFTLLFPVYEMEKEEPAAPIPAPAEPAQAAPKGQKQGVILLVEDEAPVRAFASRALRMRGYTVIEAANAEEALTKLEDEALEVDVFVTDVVMPGLDGPSWVRKAREKRPNVHVVFVSGYAEDVFGTNKEQIPNSVFLPKPFSLNELTATVQDRLH